MCLTTARILTVHAKLKWKITRLEICQIFKKKEKKKKIFRKALNGCLIFNKRLTGLSGNLDFGIKVLSLSDACSLVKLFHECGHGIAFIDRSCYLAEVVTIAGTKVITVVLTRVLAVIGSVIVSISQRD